MYYVLWVQKYIRSGCRLQVNPVDVIYPVGDILWDTFYVMWVLFFILWTTLFISCGEHVSCLYPVENISCGERHPQVFSTGHVSNLILWVYPVESLSFTDVLRCNAHHLDDLCLSVQRICLWSNSCRTAVCHLPPGVAEVACWVYFLSSAVLRRYVCPRYLIL